MSPVTDPRYTPPSFELDIHRVQYELERFGARIIFAPEVLHSIEVRNYRDVVGERLVTELLGVVAMWKEQRVLKVPANWWQHFKQRWFPAWALTRWPVLFEHYDAGVILPKVPVVKPEFHTVEFPVWVKNDGAYAG